MCGIAGYIRPRGLFDNSVHARMIASIRHRGPDGDGVWTDSAAGLALLHTRLRIQDLTEAAHQPMTSDDGSTTLTFNGEIYNFHELREELRAAGAVFHSTGDTAVLLELCRRDPALGFLSRLNGMFAFAVWHAPTRTLTLARDRTGVKPLLFLIPQSHNPLIPSIAFASELAALRRLIDRPIIDPDAVYQLLTLGFIAAPRTIFKDVSKLPPGHLLRWRQGLAQVEKWAPDPPMASAIKDIPEACARLRDLVADAVRVRLLADVPVGLFLSGGIDSSIVTAVASKVAGHRVKTYSIGFPDHPFYDETRYARAVAEMHGTDHTVLPLSIDEIRDIIPTVQSHLGEPFADSSALPTYLLSRLTRRHVTVALSGDGADELFAGYNRYAATRLSARLGWFARTPLYRLSRRLIEALPGRRETAVGSRISQMKRAIRSIDPRLPHRYAYWMRTADDRALQRILGPLSLGERDSVRADHQAVSNSIADLLWQHRGEPRASNDLNCHLRTEWRLSLPDDMLTKVDLMSMAHGLEVRSPFLDYRIVDLVMPLPWQWKLCGNRKKHLLQEAFRNDLPPMLHNRPKKGFEVPVGVWLRGPLYDFARGLIDGDRLFFGSLLSREGALATLDEHAAGRADHNFHLWAIVSLLAWQQEHASDSVIQD